MGMKLKSGADLCGFELSRFCVQNDVAIPDAPASGRKYFHTGTGMEGKYSLLGRERIFTGTAWRSAAYVDDLANLDLATNADYLALKEKVELLSGEVDTDAIINNMKEVTAFLEGFAEDANLMSVLDGKLDKTGGTIVGNGALKLEGSGFSFAEYYSGSTLLGRLGFSGVDTPAVRLTEGWREVLHSGNVGDYAITTKKWLEDDDIPLNTTGMWTNHGGYLSAGWSASYKMVFLTATNGIKVRIIHGGSDTDWKTIAFTDSNVASANALVNSFGVTYAYATDGVNAVLGYKGYSLYLDGTQIRMRYGSSNTTGFILNSSGNIIIGPSSTPNGRLKIVGEDTSASTPALYIANSGGNPLLDVRNNGNVLIGTNEDNGTKLQVNGDITIKPQYSSLIFEQIAYLKSYGNKRFLIHNQNGLFFGLETTDVPTEIYGQRINLLAETRISKSLSVANDIVANGTVACKGVAAEGSAPVGTVDKWAGSIASGTKSQTYTHGLGTTDITVAIYEKNGNEWVQILTDVDIVNANAIRVTFGANTTVEHRIVVMG